ncbi:hypothetical protein GCM10023088_50260 [Actinomadura verrucosospora]
MVRSAPAGPGRAGSESGRPEAVRSEEDTCGSWSFWTTGPRSVAGGPDKGMLKKRHAGHIHQPPLSQERRKAYYPRRSGDPEAAEGHVPPCLEAESFV